MKKLLLLPLVAFTCYSAGYNDLFEVSCGYEIDAFKQLVNNGISDSGLDILDNNINKVNKNGDSVFAHFAMQSGGETCNKIVEYLSSIGAEDSGATLYDEGWYKYDTPKVFETKHLKLTIIDVKLAGHSTIILESKIPAGIQGDTNYIKTNSIYFKNALTDINSNKRFFDYQNQVIAPSGKLETFLYVFDENKSKMPKIVKNKVNFTRQATFKYTYKGKEYELKTPVIKDEIDVDYSKNKSLF